MKTTSITSTFIEVHVKRYMLTQADASETVFYLPNRCINIAVKNPQIHNQKKVL